MKRWKRGIPVVAAAAALAGLTLAPLANATDTPHGSGDGRNASTATPIKHLVVIFDENVSFDHYFGTYPYATNPPGEPTFSAVAGTPTVNGLYSGVGAGGPTGPLLTHNPNLSNPLLLNTNQPMTCDQNHGYTAEQTAADHGAEDLYVQNTGRNTTLATCLAGLTDQGQPEPVPAGASSNYAVMDYYDGNTVTGLWNLAQHFSLADNFYSTTYGPSTPGALNVTSAQTYGALCGPSYATINDPPCAAPAGYNASDVLASDLTANQTTVANQAPAGPGTTYSDADPAYDICSYAPSAAGGDGNAPSNTIAMGGPNIGDELTTAGITWGWFEGGFDNGYVPGQGPAPTTAQVCSQTHTNVGGKTVVDYIPHHNPFEYYASTANPMHLPPSSVATIGQTDQANHNYDLADFWAAANTGHLPAVSYLKASGYQDGHGGYSDPLDEQTFLANTINHLETLPTWKSTAVVVTYDDSDGWYDHVLGPIQSQSQTSLDTLTAANQCGAQLAQVPQTSTGQPEQGKCGLGPRLPLLIVSPYSRSNYVDSSVMDQGSILKFIEDNWSVPALGNGAADARAGDLTSMLDFSAPTAHRVFLDPSTGQVTHRQGSS
jgi:phospholipase C